MKRTWKVLLVCVVAVAALAGYFFLLPAPAGGEDFQLLEKIEELGIPMIQNKTGSDMPMCANVDMYSGLVYTMLGIPEDVFTPLFASARIAGWCANRMEEVITGHRIMRPAYRAVTIRGHYVPMEERTSRIKEFDL